MLNQPGFHAPTDHYDERVKSIDEEIAASIAKRQAVAEGHPGFPRAEYLEAWANQHALPVSILQQTFRVLQRWPVSRERVIPERYLRFIPLMRTKNLGDIRVFIPYVRQYSNCGLILVEVEGAIGGRGGLDIRLIIEGYDCQFHGGRGDRFAADHVFLVTPPIPDAIIQTLTMTVEFESHPLHRNDPAESVTIPPTTVTLEPQDVGDGTY